MNHQRQKKWHDKDYATTTASSTVTVIVVENKRQSLVADRLPPWEQQNTSLPSRYIWSHPAALLSTWDILSQCNKDQTWALYQSPQAWNGRASELYGKDYIRYPMRVFAHAQTVDTFPPTTWPGYELRWAFPFVMSAQRAELGVNSYTFTGCGGRVWDLTVHHDRTHVTLCRAVWIRGLTSWLLEWSSVSWLWEDWVVVDLLRCSRNIANETPS